jgi:3-hydroxybutyrate dehydrogenase
MTLKGKTALITGSTSGIGAGIAEKFASCGANIIITGLVAEQNAFDAFLESLKSYHTKITYIPADILTEQACKDLIFESNKLSGQIDILINNAGTQCVSPVESFPLDKWELILNLNLSAPFRLIQNILPLMREQKFGRIINIASAHGLVASKHKAAYVAAKHGLVGLTKVVALETAQENITVNAICPGWVLTPLVQAQIDKIALDNNLSNEQASKKLLCEKQPSEAFVLPEQIGALAVFLSSDDAAQITGTTHSIDGGWTAQ